MPTQPAPTMEPVTGIARGNLGTATNLDDTQVYALDELRAANIEPEPLPLPAVRAPAAAVRAPAAAVRAPVAPVQPPAPATAVPVERAPATRGKRTGLIAAGATAALLGLAVMLSVRDGVASGPGGADQGAGDAAEIQSPAAATEAPAATAPAQAEKGKGKGNGNGKGPKN